MRKLIGAINMTVDGYCDHTLINPDDEIHQHYATLLSNAGAIIYGRITYQLMTYWKTLLDEPSGIKATDDFAIQMDKVKKIVFSRTLTDTGWDTATLATRSLEDEVAALKEQDGNDVFVGSPGLIASLTASGLIDELQLCIHPVIAGNGLPLFKSVTEMTTLKLIKTKVFSSGAVILYYEAGKR